MRILIHAGDDTVDDTLDHFLEVNDLEPEDVADIRAALEAGRPYLGGGGAAAEFTLERA